PRRWAAAASPRPDISGQPRWSAIPPLAPSCGGSLAASTSACGGCSPRWPGSPEESVRPDSENLVLIWGTLRAFDRSILRRDRHADRLPRGLVHLALGHPAAHRGPLPGLRSGDLPGPD